MADASVDGKSKKLIPSHVTVDIGVVLVDDLILVFTHKAAAAD